MSGLPPEAPASPDRTKLARIGLTFIGISLLVARNPLGILPLFLGMFLPSFRILGWWLTVVLTVAMLALTVGQAIVLARTWSTLGATQAQGYYFIAVMGLCLIGAVMSLVGLLSPGTRRAVEQRTLAVAPHAFDKEQ